MSLTDPDPWGRYSDEEPAAIQACMSATQAPETPLTGRAWKALAASRVRNCDNAGAARAYREADRDDLTWALKLVRPHWSGQYNAPGD